MFSPEVWLRYAEEVHVMGDIETLATSGDSVITQIGAVAYRISDEPGVFLRDFTTGITISSCVDAGLFLDPKTIQWWFEQEDAAIKMVFDPKQQVPLKEALSNFRQFYNDIESKRSPVYPNGPARKHFPAKRLWGHGATFDCVILNNAYRAIDSRAPFSFRDARDTRTLFDMVDGGDWSEGNVYGPKHDALADAKRQAVVVQRAFRALAGGAV